MVIFYSYPYTIDLVSPVHCKSIIIAVVCQFIKIFISKRVHVFILHIGFILGFILVSDIILRVPPVQRFYIHIFYIKTFLILKRVSACQGKSRNIQSKLDIFCDSLFILHINNGFLHRALFNIVLSTNIY